MLELARKTAEFLKNFIKETPKVAIVLGSGLGKLQNEVEIIESIAYEDIPNFPKTTVEGHSGKLIYGKIDRNLVLMMSGRFHYYEGYSMQEVTFPFRVFHLLGIKNLIVSNASGGVNPNFKVGNVMIITDHINMFPEHPLRGKNDKEFGVRFPDMSQAYNKKFIEYAEEIAKNNQIEIQKGVYVGLQGPTFETPAEYGMIRFLGGDAVGMSTVPEVIVARHQNMNCFAISVITDLGGPEISIPVSHEEVLNAANFAMPNVILLVKGIINKI